MSEDYEDPHDHADYMDIPHDNEAAHYRATHCCKKVEGWTGTCPYPKDHDGPCITHIPPSPEVK